MPSIHTQIWLLAGALALHEAEEWDIYGWYQRNYVEMPANRSEMSIRFFLVFLSLLGFAWAGFAQIWGDAKLTSWIIMPLVGLIVQNLLQHVYWQIRFREYAPGLGTAALLLTPMSVAIVITSIKDNLIPAWYLFALAVAIIPGLVDTVRSGNRLSQGILAIHRFSISSLKLMGLSGAEGSRSGDAAS